MQEPDPSPLAMHPLELFYERDGRSLPQAVVVNENEVPAPFDKLLVHDRDMTPTLESFYRDRIHLRRLTTLHEDMMYAREVVLELDEDNRPVEYGANRVHLENFPEICRALIVEGYTPLGTIMGEHLPGHYSRPAGFFQVAANATMEQAFGQTPLPALYGRRNVIFRADGKMLSEVVEILAPVLD